LFYASIVSIDLEPRSAPPQPRVDQSAPAPPPPARALSVGRLVLAVLVLVGLALWLWPRSAASPAIEASGSIEATEVDLRPKVSGRLVDLRVKDGTRVEKGMVLARLDGTEQRYALQQAGAAVAQARARLEEARVALGQQQAAQAASEAQAGAALDTSKVRVPQAAVGVTLQSDTVEAQVGQARAQVEAAEANAEAAHAAVASAEAGLENARVAARRARDDRVRYDRLEVLGYVTTQHWEQAVAAEDTADAQIRAAQAQLGAAEAQARAAGHGLVQARAALDLAEAGRSGVAARRYDVAAARTEREQARAALRLTRANAALTDQRRREVEAARAALSGAQAGLRQARANCGYTVLEAPFRGVVLRHSAEVGDLVAIGGTVLTIGDLDHPYLRVFVSERDLGRVRLGQAAEVTVDAFPGRTFKGKVDEVRDRAEYTLGNVQTREERVKLVFGVRILLDNPDWALKPGLPADAVLAP
jgi:multidrug resistance efflux pump